ncbi:MAG: cytochrome C oxidase subunit IV family protein [Sterolibacteriaceae bacterium MAG5]|nr:cytochrome C oxidase subunit IV family protein [Candidatus Nitricoxidireducens bremensis]
MPGHAEKVWLLLVALTGAGAWLGETGEPGWALGLTVAGLIAFKGRLVIDHYMDMADASPPLRRVLHAFVVLVPLLVLASQGFGAAIARLTTIG